MTLGYKISSYDHTDYPIHKAIIDGTLSSLLSLNDPSTQTSFRTFAQDVDPFGNTPLMLATKTLNYQAVDLLLQSGYCDYKHRPLITHRNAFEEAKLIGC